MSVSFDATSLTTKNKQRDNHLRSADFFDIENHPMVVLTVTEAKPLDGVALVCKGTLEAAGHLEPIKFTAHVQDFTDRAVTMTADLVVDRLRFGRHGVQCASPPTMRVALSPRGSFAPDASHSADPERPPPAVNVPAWAVVPVTHRLA